MEYFGLKLGQDLGNRAAHPYQKFRGVPPPPPPPGEKVTSPNIKINDVVSSDKQCIANAFNKFFASAASKLMAIVRSTCGHNQRDPNMSIRQYPPFNFLEISEEFVLSQLRSLKSGKAVGLDRTPARLLKDSTDIIVKPVTFIINTSLRTSKVPCD